jgi:hypothetical protein
LFDFSLKIAQYTVFKGFLGLPPAGISVLDKMTAGLRIPIHPHPNFGFTGA